MAYNVTLIPGDGVGPEITEATKRVLEATGVKFNWEIGEVGSYAMEKYGTPLPASVIESVRKNKVALKGPVTTPVGSGFRSVNVALRKELELFVCLRPCKTYPGVPSRFQNIDLIMVRENLEDLYAGIEFEKGTPEAANLIKFIADAKKGAIRPDSGISIKPISEFRSKRIVKFAFDYARQYHRKKVTAVHKANIMKFSDGLFLACAHEVAKDYPDIEFEQIIVDNLCTNLIQKPQRFDILLLPNLYGDIVSNLCCGLVGGLGVVPEANIGGGIAIFEPMHGSVPKYAGMNKVDPVAGILSGVLMLNYLNERDAANRMERAVAQVLAEGKSVTYDLKSDRNSTSAIGTFQMADAIITCLRHGTMGFTSSSCQ